MAIDTEEAGDYMAIKRAILKRYDVNEELYRRRLRARTTVGITRKPDESYVNLATDIMDLGRKWLSECKDLSDALVLNSCCQSYLKRYVYGCGSTNQLPAQKLGIGLTSTLKQEVPL